MTSLVYIATKDDDGVQTNSGWKQRGDQRNKDRA